MDGRSTSVDWNPEVISHGMRNSTSTSTRDLGSNHVSLQAMNWTVREGYDRLPSLFDNIKEWHNNTQNKKRVPRYVAEPTPEPPQRLDTATIFRIVVNSPDFFWVVLLLRRMHTWARLTGKPTPAPSAGCRCCCRRNYRFRCRCRALSSRRW